MIHSEASVSGEDENRDRNLFRADGVGRRLGIFFSPPLLFFLCKRRLKPERNTLTEDCIRISQVILLFLGWHAPYVDVLHSASHLCCPSGHSVTCFYLFGIVSYRSTCITIGIPGKWYREGKCASLCVFATGSTSLLLSIHTHTHTDSYTHTVTRAPLSTS